MTSKTSKSVVRLFNVVVISCILVALGGFAWAIGAYSKAQTLGALSSKAANTADLASIALSDPLWNFDTATMDNIFKAIFLDADVIAIRVVKVEKDSSAKSAPVEHFRDPANKATFDALGKSSDILATSAKIVKDSQPIATVDILTSSAKAKASASATSAIVAGFALALAALMGLITYLLGGRIIKAPIDRLRAVADRLAAGDLDVAVDATRDDEIGALAHSFDRMRSAIKKKLSDMDILNRTGETMAGTHDQDEAIETAIKVMSDQTHVERGSIYLLDPATRTLTLHACHPPLSYGSEVPLSFRLDEGVAGQVAASGKTLFVPDITQSPAYVAAAGVEEPKALLCVPMMDDQKVFGIMNFIGAPERVRFAMEDEAFALTIARMAVVTIKNIQMLKVIEEQNQTLEERILERTAELRAKTNDVNNMLQNMRQGIFTIVEGGAIHPEHSAYLLDIFEPGAPPAGQPAVEFLFGSGDVGADAANQVAATIEAVIGEDPMNFEFNAHLFVSEYTVAFPDGRHKTVALDWNPVIADDAVDKIMVTARDVTELKALQRETEKQKADLELIGQILAISKDKFLDFVSTTKGFLDGNETLIRRAAAKDEAVLGELFRNMHTVKGNARTYGLTHVGNSVHGAETAYSRLRSDSSSEWPKDELLADLAAVRSDLDKYERTYKDRLAGFAASAGSQDFDHGPLAEIAKAVSSIGEGTPAHELLASLAHVRKSVDALTSEPLEQALSGVAAAVPSIARQLGKNPPSLRIDDGQVRLRKEIVPVLRNVFMHLFRNSLDHGLESMEDRLAAGKPATGSLRLGLALDPEGGSMTLRFSDDGRGLALAAIEAKSRAMGKIGQGESLSDEQLAESIFTAGLSTADLVTEVSGRGVGMDAVRSFLRKHGGDVRAVFDGPRKGSFRPFHIEVELPDRYAVKA